MSYLDSKSNTVFGKIVRRRVQLIPEPKPKFGFRNDAFGFRYGAPGLRYGANGLRYGAGGLRYGGPCAMQIEVLWQTYFLICL